MTFQFDPEELHQFPDRLFRRELLVNGSMFWENEWKE